MKIENIIYNIILSWNDIKFENLKISIISRFQHILNQNEIHELPIWYKEGYENEKFLALENRLILVFLKLFSKFPIKIYSFKDNIEEIEELRKLGAIWYSVDLFENEGEFTEFLRFNFRSKKFLRKNVIQIGTKCFLHIGDHLEIYTYFTNVTDNNVVINMFTDNNFYEHKYK